MQDFNCYYHQPYWSDMCTVSTIKSSKITKYIKNVKDRAQYIIPNQLLVSLEKHIRKLPKKPRVNGLPPLP